MANFKSFIKKKYHPIPIYETPVHGGHADPEAEKIAKKEKKKLDEAFKDHPSFKDLTTTNLNPHIADNQQDVHDYLTDMYDLRMPNRHSMPQQEADEVKRHEKEGKSQFTPDEKEALYKYSEHSHRLNMKLIEGHKEGKSDKEALDITPEQKELLKKHGEKWDAVPWSHEDHYAHEDAMYAKENIKEHQDQVKHLDSAMHKSKNAREHDMYVMHGLKNWHPGKEAAKHPDGHIMLPAYTSTSIDPSIGHGFTYHDTTAKVKDPKNPNRTDHTKIPTAHVLKIHVKPEHKGVYLGKYSAHDHEHEFLLPRKTVLKIHKKPTIHTDTQHYEYTDWGAPGSPTKTRINKRRTHVWHAEIVHQHGDDDHETT